MNRLAVVLAADSASTVTHWGESGKEERYFKGANKIFQLSTHHPVGMMIFDAADILRVPWEIVVKEFRSSLADKSFNSLDGYASEFFSFLNANTWLFPLSVQKEDAVNVLAHATGEAKSLVPEKLRQALLAVKGYVGAEGTYTFDKNGDGLHGYNIVKNNNGTDGVR
jgi:hypothetical protein